MRRTLLALTALAALVPALPARAAPAAAATPAAPWQASDADGLCRTQRDFTLGGQPHLLILEQSAPNGMMGIALAGPSLAGLDAKAPLSLRFAADQSDLVMRARIEPNARYGQVAVLNEVALSAGSGESNRIDPALAEAVEGITVAQGTRAVTFATGSLADAVQVLNACTAQIMRGWGFDPAVQYALQRRAAPADPKRIGRRLVAAYGRPARRLAGGRLELVLFVDAEGLAQECRMIVTSNDPELDEAACKALTGERFTPALDAAGRPVASFWVTGVRFALSPGDAARFAR